MSRPEWETTDDFSRVAQSKGFKVTHQHFEDEEMPQAAGRMNGCVIFDDGTPEALQAAARVRASTRDLGTPLVVVSSDFDRELHASFKAVGATLVCDPDETSERVLAEILSRHDLGVGEAQKIRQEWLQPFIAAVMEAMEIMAQCSVQVEEIYRKSDKKMQGYISGIIYLIAKVERILSVTLSYKTGRELARRLLGDIEQDPSPEVVCDAAAEMVNIVAGQVKGRFVETPYEFDISTPTIITGKNHEIHHDPSLPCFVIAFKSDLGPITMQLCIRPR
jgi:chemotaxis protein CheX